MSLLKVAGTTATSGQLYVDSVFSTWLYTGNGSTQTITNGIDLAGKGGMVWQKIRSSAASHIITDTVRGTGYFINSNNTNGQTYNSNVVSSFNSNGFTDAGSQINGSTYASWTFRKATKFFDVVTYTGDGVSGRFINHSLTIRPGLMFIKRTDTTSNWVVMSNALSYSMWLNSTNADVSSNNVNGYILDFTASSFQVNAGSTSINAVNASGGTYVAYLFAHDTSSTGIIQCGNYTGNGSATGPVVTLGWEPQYLMIKNASGTGNWQVIDSMRGMPVGSADATLQANSAAAESSVDYLSPTATGFQITSTSTEVNTSGSTYIYMAIRRPNKPPTSGTQVFSPNQTSGTTGTAITTSFPVDWQLLGINSGNAENQRSITRLTGVNTDGSSNGQYLITSSTAIEAATGTFTLNWGNTGYQVPSFNSGSPIIGWNFKRAPGFFDVVCYTGTGSATTQAHNLSVVPELMIVKRRSGVPSNWWVYVSSIGNTKYSTLNSTAIPVTNSTAWNNTTPTASVFSIGTGTQVNASAETYVAYLFATLAGISKVGSYTGNGTTQTINCGFTGGARFVLIKRTDSTGDWYVFDTARGMTTLTDPYLLLNSTAAEVATLGAVTSVTTGFAVNAAIVAAINTNAASYIFLAIA